MVLKVVLSCVPTALIAIIITTEMSVAMDQAQYGSLAQHSPLRRAVFPADDGTPKHQTYVQITAARMTTDAIINVRPDRLTGRERSTNCALGNVMPALVTGGLTSPRFSIVQTGNRQLFRLSPLSCGIVREVEHCGRVGRSRVVILRRKFIGE
jgi:hypothetical protein